MERHPRGGGIEFVWLERGEQDFVRFWGSGCLKLCIIQCVIIVPKVILLAVLSAFVNETGPSLAKVPANKSALASQL